MSTPDDLQLPQAERAAVFRAMVQIIRNDPIVMPTLQTFLAWEGGLDDSVKLEYGMAPALRITPTGGPDEWSSPPTMVGPLYLNCEILTVGFNVDNPANLWRAIIAAFYDPQGTTFDAIQATLRAAGAYPPSPMFTQPAFDPKPEGNFCWGIAQIRIMVQTQLGSRGAPA